MRSVRSAKGETVDFDLIKIKEQMAGAPKSVEVIARERFIDQKLKRRLKRTVETIKSSLVPVEPTIPVSIVEPPKEPVNEPPKEPAKEPVKLALKK